MKKTLFIGLLYILVMGSCSTSRQTFTQNTFIFNKTPIEDKRVYFPYPNTAFGIELKKIFVNAGWVIITRKLKNNIEKFSADSAILVAPSSFPYLAKSNLNYFEPIYHDVDSSHRVIQVGSIGIDDEYGYCPNVSYYEITLINNIDGREIMTVSGFGCITKDTLKMFQTQLEAIG